MIKKTKKKKKVRIYFIKKKCYVLKLFFLSACLYDDMFTRSGDLKQPGRKKKRVETSRIYTDDFTPSKTYQEF